MKETHNIKVPGWFYAVAALALIWNGLGVVAYIQQMMQSPEALAELPEIQRHLLMNTPAWATAAFALAVFGGAIGSLLLLLRSRFALPVLLLSLLGIAVQMFYNLGMSNALEAYGPGGLVMPVMVALIGAALVWLARIANARGWCR